MEALGVSLHDITSCLLRIHHQENGVYHWDEDHGVGHGQQGRAVEDDDVRPVLDLPDELFHLGGCENESGVRRVRAAGNDTEALDRGWGQHLVDHCITQNGVGQSWAALKVSDYLMHS